jgi:hypothetical protein
MHEIVCIASIPEDAKESVLDHVKATNELGSERTQEESKAVTKALSIERVGHKTCL